MIKGKGYLSIRQIDDFFLFTDVGYRWTGFLLESLVSLFSDKYMVIEIPAYTISRAKGIIIDIESGIQNYEELLKNAIKKASKFGKFNSVRELNYWLSKEGLIIKLTPKSVREANYIVIDGEGKLSVV